MEQIGHGAVVAHEDGEDRYHQVAPHRPVRPTRPAAVDVDDLDDEDFDDVEDDGDRPVRPVRPVRPARLVDERQVDEKKNDPDDPDSPVAFGVAATILGVGAAIPFLPAAWLLPAVATAGAVTVAGFAAFVKKHGDGDGSVLPWWLRMSEPRGPRGLFGDRRGRGRGLFGGGRGQGLGIDLPKIGGGRSRARGSLGRAMAALTGGTGSKPRGGPRARGSLGRAIAALTGGTGRDATGSKPRGSTGSKPRGGPRSSSKLFGGGRGKGLAALTGGAVASRLRRTPGSGPRSAGLLRRRNAATGTVPVPKNGKKPRTVLGQIRQARKDAKQKRATVLHRARVARGADVVQRRINKMKARWDKRDARKQARRDKRAKERQWYREWWKGDRPGPVNTLRGKARRARRWLRVQRIASARKLSSRWRRLVAKAVPQWWSDLNKLSADQGTKAAFALALALALAAMKKGGRWIKRQVWAEKPTPVAKKAAPAPTPPRRRPDGASPTGTVAPAPIRPTVPSVRPRPATAPTNQAPTRPTAPGRATRTTGGIMHDGYRRFLEAAHLAIGHYHPEHVRDLESYLRTQPAALHIRGQHWHDFAATLTAQHPGAAAAQGFFHGMGDGFYKQAHIAAQLYADYELADAATLARFRNPRVNEHKADVDHALNTAQHIGLDVREMHPLHYHLIEAGLHHIAQFVPVDTGELLDFLASLPEGLAMEGSMYVDLGNRLTSYPVDKAVPGFFADYGVSYLDLAEIAGDVNSGFRIANPDDVERAENPHPMEQWRNVSVPSA